MFGVLLISTFLHMKELALPYTSPDLAQYLLRDRLWTPLL